MDHLVFQKTYRRLTYEGILHREFSKKHALISQKKNMHVTRMKAFDGWKHRYKVRTTKASNFKSNTTPYEGLFLHSGLFDFVAIDQDWLFSHTFDSDMTRQLLWHCFPRDCRVDVERTWTVTKTQPWPSLLLHGVVCFFSGGHSSDPGLLMVNLSFQQRHRETPVGLRVSPSRLCPVPGAVKTLFYHSYCRTDISVYKKMSLWSYFYPVEEIM